EIPARININTAPPEVLQALWAALAQKLDPGDATTPPDTTNVNLSDPVYQTTAWLMTRADLKVKSLKALEKYITTHSQVYRLQVIGQLDSGASARIEAVIDTNTVSDGSGNVTNRPRIVYRRDLTELGKGFDIQP